MSLYSLFGKVKNWASFQISLGYAKGSFDNPKSMVLLHYFNGSE